MEIKQTQVPPISNDILDIKGASQLLGYEVSSLYQLTCRRIIPYYKIPGLRKVYFSKTELEEWIKQPSNKVLTSHDLALLAINRSQN